MFCLCYCHCHLSQRIRESHRITKKLIKHVNKINWNGIDFPASALDYKTFEQINEDIALNILYVPFNQMDICQEYISKHNFTRKIQVIFLKISDGEKWHFIALKSDCEDNSDYMRPTKSFSRLMCGI